MHACQHPPVSHSVMRGQEQGWTGLDCACHGLGWAWRTPSPHSAHTCAHADQGEAAAHACMHVSCCDEPVSAPCKQPGTTGGAACRVPPPCYRSCRVVPCQRSHLFIGLARLLVRCLLVRLLRGLSRLRRSRSNPDPQRQAGGAATYAGTQAPHTVVSYAFAACMRTGAQAQARAAWASGLYP